MPSNERKPVFDRIGDRYTKDFHQRDAQRAAAQWLLDKLPPGARVVDLGCGTGQPAAEQLAAGGLEVLGVDESPVMVDLATGKVPTATFVVGDGARRDASLSARGPAGVTNTLSSLQRPRP